MPPELGGVEVSRMEPRGKRGYDDGYEDNECDFLCELCYYAGLCSKVVDDLDELEAELEDEDNDWDDDC